MTWYERYMNHPDNCKCRGCECIGVYNDAIVIKQPQSPKSECPSCAAKESRIEELEEAHNKIMREPDMTLTKARSIARVALKEAP